MMRWWLGLFRIRTNVVAPSTHQVGSLVALRPSGNQHCVQWGKNFFFVAQSKLECLCTVIFTITTLSITALIFVITTLGIITFVITTLSIMIFNMTIFSIITFNLMTFSIKTLSIK